jgi:hypothetical protein
MSEHPLRPRCRRNIRIRGNFRPDHGADLIVGDVAGTKHAHRPAKRCSNSGLGRGCQTDPRTNMTQRVQNGLCVFIVQGFVPKS